MLVTELRQRMLGKVAQVSGQGDEATTATVLAYARAALTALAGRPEDQEVALQYLTVGTRTAALILGLHPEYVRLLIRRGRLQATKENGEYQIALASTAELAAAGAGATLERGSRTGPSFGLLDLWEAAESSTVLWKRPDDVAEAAG